MRYLLYIHEYPWEKMEPVFRIFNGKMKALEFIQNYLNISGEHNIITWVAEEGWHDSKQWEGEGKDWVGIAKCMICLFEIPDTSEDGDSLHLSESK